MDVTYKYPLDWPMAEPRTRTADRTGCAYKTRTAYAELERLERELRMLGAEDVLVTSNVPVRRDGTIVAPRVGQRYDDPGVAVYFRLGGQSKCLPCDRWALVEWNLHAITLSINAIRALERHGCPRIVTKAFAGMTLLPAPEQWWNVLGCEPDDDIDAIEETYRALAKEAHPDVAGEAAEGRMSKLNWAIGEARAFARASQERRA